MKLYQKCPNCETGKAHMTPPTPIRALIAAFILIIPSAILSVFPGIQMIAIGLIIVIALFIVIVWPVWMIIWLVSSKKADVLYHCPTCKQRFYMKRG